MSQSSKEPIGEILTAPQSCGMLGSTEYFYNSLTQSIDKRPKKILHEYWESYFLLRKPKKSLSNAHTSTANPPPQHQNLRTLGVIHHTLHIHPERRPIIGEFPPAPLRVVIVPLRTAVQNLVHAIRAVLGRCMRGRIQNGVEFRIHLRYVAHAPSLAQTLGRTSDNDIEVLVRLRAVGPVVQ